MNYFKNLNLEHFLSVNMCFSFVGEEYKKKKKQSLTTLEKMVEPEVL